MDRRGIRRAALAALGVWVLLLAGGCGDESDRSSDGADSVATDSPGESSPSETSSESPGGSDSESPSEEPSETAPPGTPGCATVWREGARLPRIYSGCVEGGTYVERDAMGCSSGQRMVTYDNRFWAVPGGTVKQAEGPLAKDRAFRQDVLECSA